MPRARSASRALTVLCTTVTLAAAAGCDASATTPPPSSSSSSASTVPQTPAGTPAPQTSSQTAPHTSPTRSTTSTAPAGSTTLKAAATAMVRAGEPGAIVLSRRGTKLMASAAGLARKSPARAMQVADRVHIASITKTFVSTVVLQLVAKRRLSLSDPLSKVLPGVLAGTQYDPATITVRELLQHTSGIRDYAGDPRLQTRAGVSRSWTAKQLVAIAVQQGSPYTAWSYSNTNYVLLGMIIARLTGHSVAHEIQTRIITPLHLRDTSFPLTSTDIPGPHADGYVTPYGDVTGAVNPSVLGAAGAMISSASDVARFLSALMNGTLLPAAQVRQMLTTIPVVDNGLFTERYGLGIYSVHLPCGTAWGHDGDYPGGYRSYAFTNRAGTRQGVVLDNDSGLTDQPSNPTLRTAVQRAVVAAVCS